MNRLVLAGCLLIGSATLLASCASEEDEPFAPYPAASSGDEAPVAGVPTHPPESSGAGWNW